MLGVTTVIMTSLLNCVVDELGVMTCSSSSESSLLVVAEETSEAEEGDGLTEADVVSIIGRCCLVRTSIEPNRLTLDSVDERRIELASYLLPVRVELVLVN